MEEAALAASQEVGGVQAEKEVSVVGWHSWWCPKQSSRSHPGATPAPLSRGLCQDLQRFSPGHSCLSGFTGMPCLLGTVGLCSHLDGLPHFLHTSPKEGEAWGAKWPPLGDSGFPVSSSWG